MPVIVCERRPPASASGGRKAPDGVVSGALRPPLAKSRKRTAASRLAAAHLAVVGLGLLGADQAVAVGVDGAELLVGAEELAARHVAVAVGVHLAEPQRPALRAPGGDHARQPHRLPL